MLLRAIDLRQEARAIARQYESLLPVHRRKSLGQFFTGLPLGKLLAHLALTSDMETVVDPMAGHGDLLDAVWEAAEERSIPIAKLDGIEIDAGAASTCRERLSKLLKGHNCPSEHVLTGSAFDPDIVGQLLPGGYDLVISNPPYVRYQARKGRGVRDDDVRTGLEAVMDRCVGSLEASFWRHLIQGYSGLADLSVPSWLLAGLLVRPGGRLALVVPATWRSRDYGDLIRYFLLRCFAVEYIVEDTQTGWFGEALVRTHLVIAKRLSSDEAARPLKERESFSSVEWVQVTPEAGNDDSLVGNVFGGASPEGDFSNWLRDESRDSQPGIQLRQFCLRQEWDSLKSRIGTKRWYLQTESPVSELPLFTHAAPRASTGLPEAVRDIFTGEIEGLGILEDLGIHVGQGLRTGCNQFFYVTECSSASEGLVRVQASQTLSGQEFAVPQDALQPVLRRQPEVPILLTGQIPPGRLLDLRRWVLPEDVETVSRNLAVYLAAGEPVPQSMPSGLADLVREASQSTVQGATGTRLIPDMSAVRTNVRIPRNGSTPRFWYMLPDFTRRHKPDVFVARVNYKQPWAEANLDPPVLIDANFSSFWSTRSMWTRFGIRAMLNSAWCRTAMEALGTPLGGGALKLEASQLRRMPVPRLSDNSIMSLNESGRQLTPDSLDVQEAIDSVVLRAVLGPDVEEHQLADTARTLRKRANELQRKRYRVIG